ncbi:hypothetical protein R1sor_016526 [Riccia sorocarpa]|uniref:Uncharacterized protein n=1 Tax=Riccia sorocarpa TaxID=122646 RepID=A0ABD3HI11_9MARC
MGVIISLPVGITRTLVGVVQKFVLRQNKPLRIDLPLPFIPIDVIVVPDASQIVSINRDSDVNRLHAHPTESFLPGLSGTSRVMTLKENVDTPIEHLFTRKVNCPTPSIPRVVTKETTLKAHSHHEQDAFCALNGLLSYPAKPASTIILLSNSSAAEQTNSLFFTFGSDGEYRVCALKDFFYNSMTALQAELKARRLAIRNGS